MDSNDEEEQQREQKNEDEQEEEDDDSVGQDDEDEDGDSAEEEEAENEEANDEHEEDDDGPASPSHRRKVSSCIWDSSGDDSPITLSSGRSQKKRPLTDVEESPWLYKTLAYIRDASRHIRNRHEMLTHPSPSSYIPHLHTVRSAALDLVASTNDAISCVLTKQAMVDRIALKQELATANKKLKESETECNLQVNLLKEANIKIGKQQTELGKQKLDFQNEKGTLESLYNEEKSELLAAHRDLKRQLEEERDKSICNVCYEKPRDTIILPCLHFQYCFACLLRHREVNSNTCPSCRGPIQGLNMSTILAGQ